jgi:hypothetical protein
MKGLMLSSLAFALLTGAALADTPAPPPGGPPAPGMKAPPPPPPPGGPEAMDDGPGGPPPSGGPRSHRPPPSKAAHFRLEHGDIVVDVKCADEESMKACADFTLQMLDRVQALPKP